MIEQVVKLDLTIPALPEGLEIPSVEIPEIHTEEGSTQGGREASGLLPQPPAYDLPSLEEHDFPTPELPEAESDDTMGLRDVFSHGPEPASLSSPSVTLESNAPEWMWPEDQERAVQMQYDDGWQREMSIFWK